MSGDKIRIENGMVFVNDTAVNEPYAHYWNSEQRDLDEWPPRLADAGLVDVTIPSGTIFVMGDNRSESTDSRIWGYVPVSGVVGKLIAKLP